MTDKLELAVRVMIKELDKTVNEARNGSGIDRIEGWWIHSFYHLLEPVQKILKERGI